MPCFARVALRCVLRFFTPVLHIWVAQQTSSHLAGAPMSQNKATQIYVDSRVIPGWVGTPLQYGYVPPERSAIWQLLIKNEVSIPATFSEKGDNIMNAAKIKFCKRQLFEITQGQIAFNKIRLNTSKLLHPVLRFVRLRAWFCAVVSIIASQLSPFFFTNVF